MARTSTELGSGRRDAPAIVNERRTCGLHDEFESGDSSWLSDNAVGIAIPASELVQVFVQHRPTPSNFRHSQRVAGGIGSVVGLNQRVTSRRVSQDTRLRLDIRVRGNWCIEICLPRWCSGILKGSVRISL